MLSFEGGHLAPQHWSIPLCPLPLHVYLQCNQARLKAEQLAHPVPSDKTNVYFCCIHRCPTKRTIFPIESIRRKQAWNGNKIKNRSCFFLPQSQVNNQFSHLRTAAVRSRGIVGGLMGAASIPFHCLVSPFFFILPHSIARSFVSFSRPWAALSRLHSVAQAIGRVLAMLPMSTGRASTTLGR